MLRMRELWKEKSKKKGEEIGSMGREDKGWEVMRGKRMMREGK